MKLLWRVEGNRLECYNYFLQFFYFFGLYFWWSDEGALSGSHVGTLQGLYGS
jgi:hypothetical protein